jgi:hypothetical protein
LWSTTAPALLHITVSPSDSVVTVNEQTIDPRSGPVAVAPGEIRLTAESRRRSHGPDTRALSVTAGEDVRVDIRLPRVEPRGVPRRVMAAVNLGYHLNDQPSSSGFPFTIYSNNGSSSVHYKVAPGFQEYDLGLSVRAWGALAVGVTHSVLETTSTGNISAQIPHPVLANAPRVLLADAPQLTRRERSIHVEVRATRGTRRFEVAGFGGPSFFEVRQHIVSDVVFRELISSVSFVRAETTELRRNSIVGFNLGADVMVMIVPYVGFGGFARYSHATWTRHDGSESERLVLGGLQTGGGFRFRF